VALSVSNDEEVNFFLEKVVSLLNQYFGYPLLGAELLVRDYYSKFGNRDYCSVLGLAVQDDDFYFHEGAGGMAVRMHYYLGLKGDPSEFLKWRKEFWSSY